MFFYKPNEGTLHTTATNNMCITYRQTSHAQEHTNKTHVDLVAGISANIVKRLSYLLVMAVGA